MTLETATSNTGHIRTSHLLCRVVHDNIEFSTMALRQRAFKVFQVQAISITRIIDFPPSENQHGMMRAMKCKTVNLVSNSNGENVT